MSDKLFHRLDSKVARSVEYDAEAKTLTVDFAKKDEPGVEPAPRKLYRYLAVPGFHFGNIVTARTTLDSEGKPGSEGSYILKYLVGPRKALTIPFAWERLDEEGNVVERSSLPVTPSASLTEAEPLDDHVAEALGLISTEAL